MSGTERLIKVSLSPLRELSGLIGACLVDGETGLVLASEGAGRGFELELAAAGNTEVVRAVRENSYRLKINDNIEDIIISLDKQYHLIRLLESNEAIFLYCVFDRKLANLALSRVVIKKVEKSIDFR